MNQEHIKKRGEYCEKHDAFYNPIKDIWLEGICENPNCSFCKDRPTKPSEVTAQLNTNSTKTPNLHEKPTAQNNLKYFAGKETHDALVKSTEQKTIKQIIKYLKERGYKVTKKENKNGM